MKAHRLFLLFLCVSLNAFGMNKSNKIDSPYFDRFIYPRPGSPKFERAIYSKLQSYVVAKTTIEALYEGISEYQFDTKSIEKIRNNFHRLPMPVIAHMMITLSKLTQQFGKNPELLAEHASQAMQQYSKL